MLIETDLSYSGRNMDITLLTIFGGYNNGSSAVISAIIPFSFKNGVMLPYETYLDDNLENL